MFAVATVLIVSIAVIGALAVAVLAFMLLKRPPPSVDQQVAELLDQGKVSDASRLLLDNERAEEGVQVLIKYRRMREAGRILLHIGDHKRAAEVFASLRDHETAANAHLKAGDRKAAALEYRKAGQLEVAANTMYQIGQHAEAAKIFLEAKQLQKAAAVLTELGQTKAAAAVMGSWYSSSGDHRAAAKSYLKAGRIREAAHECVAAGKHDKAAVLFEKLGEFASAAKAHMQAGNPEAAALHFERVGDMKTAIRLFEAAGKWNKVVECHKRDKNWLALGNIMMRLEKYDLAIEFFKRLTPLDEGYNEAAMSQAAILESLGDTEAAKAKYKEIIEFKGLTVANSQALFALCTLCEKTNSPDVPLQYLRQFGASGAVGEKVQMWIERFQALVITSAQTIMSNMEVGNEDVLQAGAAPAAAKAESPIAARTGIADRYEVVDKIGQGGHGVIYKAFDKILGREVVLKFLFRNQVPSEMARRYFLREAKTTASLNHQNIVTLYDMGQIGDNLFIAMEYLQGITLEDYLREHGNDRNYNELIYIIEQLCSALQYAHDRHIIHRDIKPGNVMLIGPDRTTVKLMDFGLAKALDDNPHKTQIICGTPLYMSPEQIVGDFVDHLSDIYSLGILVFQLFTGKTPFPAANILAHQQFTAPPHPTTVNSQVPLAVGEVILKAIEKKRENRYQRSMDLSDAIKAALTPQAAAAAPAADEQLVSVSEAGAAAADADEEVIPLDI